MKNSSPNQESFEWYYHFRQFTKTFDPVSISKFTANNMALFSPITKKWDDHLHSEWICRVYLAVKMVMSATLMINSLEYAESKNIRVTSSYLIYYALQSTLRAIVFTCPTAQWSDGSLITLSHKKTINIACDTISKLDQNLAMKIKEYVRHLKAFRELISYRAPSRGDAHNKIESVFDPIDLCTLFCEIAQAQSVFLEASFKKNAKGSNKFIDYYMEHVYQTEIGGFVFQDNEDRYRFGKFALKHSQPTNLACILAEGHVEDFFFAWWPKDEDDQENIDKKDIFNPDYNWGVIFDLP